jgi:uncharacterized protein
MVKPRGPVCNLACTYCYYLSKEQLYHESEFRMSDEVLESFTRQYIEAQRVPEVNFGWQGGEPLLMGLEFFQQATELQSRFRRPGMRISNSLQTNGTLIDDDWARFFHDHDFLIGLSIDGPQEMHDAFRRDRGGGPSFDRVMKGLSLLKKYDVDFNILTTVHSANVHDPVAVYEFLRNEAATQFIQFIPIVKRINETGFQEGTEIEPYSVTGPEYGQFLTGIFDEWIQRDVGQVFIQIFDVALAAWSSHKPGLCVFEPTCGTAMVLEHNGDLYACDHFVEPRWSLGNITQAPLSVLAGSEKQRRFGQAKAHLPEACLECDVRFVCNGGCPKNRIPTPYEGRSGLNLLCEGYKAFFRHIRHPMELMVEELRAHRPPANVMLRLVKEQVELEQRFASARRNDPCPCGSGLKFKFCHGRSRKSDS